MEPITHIVAILAAFLSLLACLRYLPFRTPTARWGGLFLFALALALLSYSLQVVTKTHQAHLAWNAVRLVSGTLLPVAWFFFVVEILGLVARKNLRIFYFIFVAPALTMAGQIWFRVLNQAEAQTLIAESGSVLRLVDLTGLVGVGYQAVFYLLGFFSAALLLRLILITGGGTRKIAIQMLVGTLGVNVLWGLDLFVDVSPGSISFLQMGLAAMAFFFIALMWHFSEILPFSGDQVIEDVHDGVHMPDYFDRALDLQHTNAFLSALVEVTANLHNITDPAQIADVLGSELEKLGLVTYIAELGPDSDDLVMTYVSLASGIIERVEKTLGTHLVHFQLNREQFPTLYEVITSNSYSFKKLEREDLVFLSGRTPIETLEKITQMIGIKPGMKALILPFRTRTRILGVLGVWGANLRSIDIGPMMVFASQVANVIERSILLENERRRSSELARANALIMALARVTSAMGSTANSDTLFGALGSELKKAGLHCAIVSIDPDTQGAVVKYLSFSPEIIQKIEKLANLNTKDLVVPKKYWPGDRIFSQRDPIWYPSPKQMMRRLFPLLPARIAQQVLSFLNFHADDQICVLPLYAWQATVGAMVIWGDGLRPEDGPIMSVFGSQVAGIFQNFKNFEQEVQRKEELARSNAVVLALANVAARLDTTSDLAEVYKTLGLELKKIQIHCMIGTLDDSGQMLRIEYISLPPEVIQWARKMGMFWPGQPDIPRHLWPAEQAVTAKTPYWDPDPIGNAGRLFPHLPEKVFQHALEMAGMSQGDRLCYLPMTIEESVIGFMAVWGPMLQPQILPGLSVFANQVATAIRNARLYDQAQAEIVERKQVEARMQAALTEKEVLLKEVHHRVKNNLQVISSLLSLQAAQQADAQTVDLLRESQNRVRSMALIHEKLYQSNDLARIDLAGYLNSLVNSLVQTYQVSPERVTIWIDCEEIDLSIDTAIPCGLIVNELVSNSFKYAFPPPRQGKIEIICRRLDAQRYHLVVADDGVGLPEALDLIHSPSLGLKLVKNLTRQVGGELEIQRSPGARFAIAFEAA